MGTKCQLMEQEIENLSKDKQELQEKFAEKSRQKRKLDEMYDKLTEYDSLKRSAIQPANKLFQRAQPDLFGGMPKMMDSNNPLKQVNTGFTGSPQIQLIYLLGLVFTPDTLGRREEMWVPAPRQRLGDSDAFEISGGSHMGAPVAAIPRKPTRPVFGAGANNPFGALRNTLISPVKRPRLSRDRPHMFML